MVGKTNAGGGAAGATLVITGVVGHSVTASNGSKTYTRTIDSTGKAVIKGLSTGTWTLTMTGDGQTATRTVDVNTDYSVTITYFSATINVTYPAGSTCKATHTDGTVLNSPDTSGTWACVVPKSGTWTILAEDTSAGKSKSVDVSIMSEGQVESVTLRYELVLYRSGDENTAVTGGWTGKPCYPYTDNTSWVITPTITRNSDNIRFYINSGAGGGIVYPANTVDLTDYKTLTLKCSTGTIHEGFFCVWKDRPPNNGEGFDYNRAINLVLASSNTYEQTYDISALTGAYSMGFGLFSNQNDTDIYLTELVCT